MLPFVLKTVEEPVQHLDNLALDVQIEFYTKGFHGEQPQGFSGWNRTTLYEAKKAAYSAFTEFLNHVSEPMPFFPIDLLDEYPHQEYVLILSVAHLYELHEICRRFPDMIRRERSISVFEYEGYKLTINTKGGQSDTSVYLVAPEKFTLFIRQVNDSEPSQFYTSKFYRSNFIDLSENTPPPFRLNAQEVIETVQQDIASRESAMPIEQLLMFPKAVETEIDKDAQLTRCPECSGELRRINESYFCLECDWDDLPPLERDL